MNLEPLREAFILKRAKAGLSFTDLAPEVGVTASTIGRFERGVGVPDMETVAKFAAWAGYPIWKVMGEVEPVQVNGKALESIEDVLKHDPSLRASDRQGLMTILRTAYERAVEK